MLFLKISRLSFRKFFSSMANSVNIKILSVGNVNYAKSLLITCHKDRYLINCGEGAQKLLIEYGINSVVDNILLTRKSLVNMAGLVGVALSLVGRQQVLYIHGIKEGVDIINSTRKFTDDKNFKIEFAERNHPDKNIIIDFFEYGLSSTDNNKCIGYLFSTKRNRDKINVPKLKQLGVTEKFLKSAEMKRFFEQSTVTVGDQTINSKDVLIASPPGEKFMVIECPTLEYVDSMTSAVPFDNFSDDSGKLRFVFHLVDKILFDHTRYRMLVDRINNSCPSNHRITHVLIDSGSTFMPSYSTFYSQAVLGHYFDKDVFPQLQMYDKMLNSEPTYNSGIDEIVYGEPQMVFSVNRITSKQQQTVKEGFSDEWMHLRSMSYQSVIDSVVNDNKYCPADIAIDELTQLKTAVIDAKRSLPISSQQSKYPIVTFIGTSSSTPSKYRNVSCILLQICDDQFVLFDCGEGSIGRIMMLFGKQKTDEIIRNLRMICVSHNHLDHHSGLYSVLNYRNSIAGDCQRCLIVGLRSVRRLILDIAKLFGTEEVIFRNTDWFMMELLPMEHNQFASEDYHRTVLDAYENALNFSLTPVRVFHTRTSYGFVLTVPKVASESVDQWKIAYSGDACPKFDGLSQAGADCDLLVHEATMDDGLEQLALSKRHSTVTQAIMEGIRMRSKFTILTHFSTRYPLVPPWDASFNNVGQSFDFMQVDIRTCRLLNLLNPFFEYLFPKHWKLIVSERQKCQRIITEDTDEIENGDSYAKRSRIDRS